MPSVSKGKDGSVSISVDCPLKCGHRVVVHWKPPESPKTGSFSKVNADGSVMELGKGTLYHPAPMAKLNKEVFRQLRKHYAEDHR